MTVNALESIIAMLRADPVVAAAAGTVTVYGQTIPAITGEIEGEWADLMEPPRRMILVREAGGAPKTERGPLSYPRFDIVCYGAEPGGRWDASELSRTVYERLFGRHKVTAGLLAITQAAGPTPGREPDTRWAYNRRTYDVLQGD